MFPSDVVGTVYSVDAYLVDLTFIGPSAVMRQGLNGPVVFPAVYF